MAGLFTVGGDGDGGDVGADGGVKAHLVHKRKHSRGRCVLGKASENVAQVIGAVSAGETVHYASLGQWSMHHLLSHLLDWTGPADLTMCTWSLSNDGCKMLIDAKGDGRLRSIHILMDWHVRAYRGAELLYLTQHCDAWRLGNSHAKVSVLVGDKLRVCVVGSANITTNPRIEAGVICSDDSTCEFHRAWIQDEIDRSDPFESEKDKGK